MNKKRSISIIILIICIIGLICLIYLHINRNRTFKFKAFNFKVPTDLKFQKISEDQFEITGEDLNIVAEIYYNSKDEDVYNQEAMYAVLLVEAGTNVYSATKEKIEDTKVLCFKKKEKTELLCYFNTINSFAYEILIKDSYSIDNLRTIFPILANAKYDGIIHKEYSYNETYEKLIEEIESEE